MARNTNTNKYLEFFDPEMLIKMCSHAKIPSKEGGGLMDEEGGASMLIPFSPLLPTQVYVLSEIVKGLKEGRNVFFIVKCRQSGITTLGHGIMQELCYAHRGLMSAFIADNAQRLFVNRRLSRRFAQSLAKYPELRQEIEEDNRYNLSFKNESVIFWLNANSQDEGGLGRSMGLPVTWGTELGLWKDEEGTLSLLSSLPEKNPRSLAVFEGTAKGPNLFKELYDNADSTGNTHQKAIFVGWWLHPWYEHNLKVHDEKIRFDTYWGSLPRFTRDESRWVEQVKQQFNFDIRPTQISWWRWHLQEQKKGNLQLMYQEYPPTPEDAWIYGGSGFMDGRKLSIQMGEAIKSRTEPRRYFIFDPGDGVHFLNSDLIEVDPQKSYYDLVCFAEPVVGPRVRYCLGWDPSHGSVEDSDHACGQVLLCYSDKAIQVAEFLKRDFPPTQMAWVILHLVGAYSSQDAETHLNIEMQGGGSEVYDEIKRLQREMAFGYTPKLMRYFQKMSHYQYVRPDSMSGQGSTVHWETSWKTRPRMLNNLKSLIERKMLDIKSEELIKDCSKINQLRDGTIEVPSQNHRVMAMAIAGMAYIQILDTDIGGLAEYSSTALEHAHDENATYESLEPNQIMTAAVQDWRNKILAEIQEEKENLSESYSVLDDLRGPVAERLYNNTGGFDPWDS